MTFDSIDPDSFDEAADTLARAGFRVRSHYCPDGDCDTALLAKALRLLLGAAEEGGMPTSRADAIHAEVMAAVLALDTCGRDADEECGLALDAVWEMLDEDDDDTDDDGIPQDAPDEPVSVDM